MDIRVFGWVPTLLLAGTLLIPTQHSLAQDAPTPPSPSASPTPAVAAPAAARAPKPEPALKLGMPAPEFKVEKFLKGKPFTAFEKGKVYIVEFWATWCGPCVMSMPHLSELQREYKDKGVTICGVNILQAPEYTDATLAEVTKFVQNKGDGMDYTVAYDGAAKHMDKAWMQAAGRDGIPCAFVVDREGTIAWIGMPSALDMVLDEVVKGTWDIATGDARVKAAAKAFRDAGEKYKESLAAGDAAWADAMKQYPLMGRTRTTRQFGAMLSAGHIKEACASGDRIVGRARQARNAGPIMEVLEALGDPAVLREQAAKELLLNAAQANFELADTTLPGPHVVLARAYFFAGQTDKGRAAAAKALELAPAETRSRMEAWLREIEEEANGR